MISTRNLLGMTLGVAVAVSACTSTPTAPPHPPLPPQVTVSASYTNTHDNLGLPSDDVFAFLVVSNGEFWVGTAAGIARYPSVTATTHAADKIVNEINGLPHPQVRSMVELDGKVYVGTWGGGIGIYDIAGNAWTQIRPGTTGLEDGYVAEIAASPTEDKLYLATNDGVYIYAPSTNSWEHFSTVDSDLNPNDTHYLENVRLQSGVSSLEVTEDLGVVQRWYGPRVEIHVEARRLGLFGITVSKNTPSVYKYSPDNSGLVEPNVNDIYYDAVRQTYWVSYVTQGISEVNVTDKTWTTSTLVQGLPSNTVYSITRADDGKGGTTIWAATQGGLAKLGMTNWEGYGRSGGLPSDRARRVYSDDGKRLWVGFVEGGAVRLKI